MSTFRRAFALVSPDVLDQVLGAWLHTRAAQVSGRLVIAVDGKAVRGAKDQAAKTERRAAWTWARECCGSPAPTALAQLGGS